MRSLVRLICTVALATVIVLVAGTATRARHSLSDVSTSSPRTVVETAGPIVGLAQDHGRVAWVAGDLDCLDAVRTRLASRPPTVILERFTDVCHAAQLNPAPIALAGQRALWAAFDTGGNHGYGSVRVGWPGTNPVRVQALLWDYVEHGEFMTDAAGDGATLVYATARVTHNYEDDQDACDAASDCRYRVTGADVFRVVGARSIVVPGAPSALLLAVSGRRIALVPADVKRTARKPSGVLVPQINTSVEVRDAVSGTLLSRSSPRGKVLALGLSDGFLAVLVSHEGRHLELRDPKTGKLVRSVAVPGTTDQLGVSGVLVVLSAGKLIYRVDASTGKLRRVTQAGARPVGLSIEGRSVVWAENLRGSEARIQEMGLG